MIEAFELWDIGEDPPLQMTEKRLAAIMRAVIRTKSKVRIAAVVDNQYARQSDCTFYLQIAIPVGESERFREISSGVPMTRPEIAGGAAIGATEGA